MSTPFWPKITDLDSASKAARDGCWAALIICCADITFGYILIGTLFGVIAIGLWMRLRTAAVAGLALLMVASGIQAISLSGPWLAIMQFLFLLMFASSVRGSFRYRAYLRRGVGETSQVERPFALAMFSVVRRIRSLRRKIFGGEVPHWVGDLYDSLLSKLNILHLIPTIWAILFFPWHFFRRVAQVVGKHPSGYRPLYGTPTNFAIQLVILTFAADRLLYTQLGFSDLNWGKFILLCIFLPLIIPAASLIFCCVAAPFRLVFQYSGFYINSTHLLVVVDPKVYRRLSLTQRCWGVLYYYGYAILVPQIAFLFAAGVLYLTFARKEVPDASPNPSFQYLLLALVLLLDRVFIVPYCALLRALVRYPTKRMLQSDVQNLTNPLGHCTFMLLQYGKAKKQGRKQVIYKQLAGVLENAVRDAWLVLERDVLRDCRLGRSLNAQQLVEFESDLRHAYSNKAFAEFAHRWKAFEPRGDERFAFVDKMLLRVDDIANGKLA
jgi:hypothetical protein